MPRIGPGAMPCGQWPSRHQAVRDLRSRGLNAAEIREQLKPYGVPLTTISAIYSRVNRAEMLGRKYRRIEVPTDTLDALAAEARDRGMTALTLITRILDTVVQDGLFDAVLDDGEGQ